MAVKRTPGMGKAPTSNSKFEGIKSRIHPVSEMELVIAALFYGRAGTGKTTLAASFPNPLLLDVREKGTDSVTDVEGLDVLKIEDWDEFERVYWYLKSKDHDYQTVIIDAITQLQDIKVTEVSGEGHVSKQEWNKISGPLKTWIINYRDLIDEGINVVFLAHDRSTEVDDGEDGELTPDMGPRLMPSVASVLNGAVKVIGNTFIREEVTKVIGGKSQREAQYCLRLGPHSRFITKIRQPKGAYVPLYIVNPTYDEIVSIIKGKYRPPEVKHSPIRKQRKGA